MWTFVKQTILNENENHYLCTGLHPFGAIDRCSTIGATGGEADDQFGRIKGTGRFYENSSKSRVIKLIRCRTVIKIIIRLKSQAYQNCVDYIMNALTKDEKS